MRAFIVVVVAAAAAACSRTAPPSPQTAQPANVLLVTIDTLRADRVGAYGYGAARTPTLDRLAANGVRFDRAYAAAPITLPSHATILTGRYAPGHGARHNGMRMDLTVPTIAEAFQRQGIATAAFVAAFPLDRRFGLIKGFAAYDDAMPRDEQGHLANERPGREVVDRALAWLSGLSSGGAPPPRFFLWVHLFEPHAPYGNPTDPAQARRPATARYDDEVAEADRQTARIVAAVQALGTPVYVVVAADHGEAFGEHGEVSHSLFVYDTTLRVPLIVAGPGIRPQIVAEPVSLADVAPTIAALAGLGTFDSDGRVLPADLGFLTGGGSSRSSSGERQIYSESFAPLLDFGWAPLRTVRRGGWKYIAAPKPELYDLEHDPGETSNLAARDTPRAAELARAVDAITPPALSGAAGMTDADARARLQALGYVSGVDGTHGPRPDPKDRRELAARLADVTSGELQGAALERALREIVRTDPGNPQANLRLGYVLMNSGRCKEGIVRFDAAIRAHVPGADAHLGRAGCEIAMKQPDAARRTLVDAIAIEPGNSVVVANLGLLMSDSGRPADAIPYLQRALTLDPDLHQARFGLAIAFARSGRRADAEREAEELLRRLPAGAPQRDEVQRLLAAVR